MVAEEGRYMNIKNPYNCTEPGNHFVGYKQLRQDLLDGFRDGHSFAVLGGRRIGKTSLLMQMENDLRTTKSSYTTLVHWQRMEACNSSVSWTSSVRISCGVI